MPSFTRLSDRGCRLFEALIHSPNLVALWVMNESSGGTLYEKGPNRLNATVNGNPTYAKAIGDLRGMDFDGTGDYASIGNVASLDFERTQAFSGLCIINPNVSAIGSIVSKRLSSGTLRGWDWQLSAGRVPILILRNDTGNQIVVTSNAALVNGTTYHLGFSYSGSSAASGVILYKDGAADADTDTENTLAATMVAAGVASIGRRNDADQDVNGDVGMLALWDRAVRAAEYRKFAWLAGQL